MGMSEDIQEKVESLILSDCGKWLKKLYLSLEVDDADWDALKALIADHNDEVIRNMLMGELYEICFNRLWEDFTFRTSYFEENPHERTLLLARFSNEFQGLWDARKEGFLDIHSW